MDVQWLILCDRAEVVAGKLYLMGGGWTRANAGEFPVDQAMGIAIGVSVPWDQTNRPHQLHLEMQDEDGHPQAKIDGAFEVGRPPGTVQGQSQIFQFTANLRAQIQTAGRFVIVASIDGKEKGRTTFEVIARPGVVPPPRTQPAT